MSQKEMTVRIPITTLLELFAQEGVVEPKPGDKIQVEVRIRQISPDGVVLAMAGAGREFEQEVRAATESTDETSEGEALRSAALWADKNAPSSY